MDMKYTQLEKNILLWQTERFIEPLRMSAMRPRMMRFHKIRDKLQEAQSRRPRVLWKKQRAGQVPHLRTTAALLSTASTRISARKTGRRASIPSTPRTLLLFVQFSWKFRWRKPIPRTSIWPWIWSPKRYLYFYLSDRVNIRDVSVRLRLSVHFIRQRRRHGWLLWRNLIWVIGLKLARQSQVASISWSLLLVIQS